jgi:hypothetical protein
MQSGPSRAGVCCSATRFEQDLPIQRSSRRGFDQGERLWRFQSIALKFTYSSVLVFLKQVLQTFKGEMFL